MRDDEGRQLQLLVNLQIPSVEFHLGHLVQGAESLVKKKELVAKKIGPEQGYTLTHPSTEFVRILVPYSCQLEGRKDVIRSGNGFCLIHLLNQEGQDDIAKHRLVKRRDRKSGSAGMRRPISYAVFCLKKKCFFFF